MTKTALLLATILIMLASCSNENQHKNNSQITDTTEQAPAHHPETDPTPGWEANEEVFKETLLAPIGKYPCKWGKTIGIELTQNGKLLKRELPCNCATYGKTGIFIVDDSISPIAGQYNPRIQMVELNRTRIRIGYATAKFLMQGIAVDTISFVRYADAFLQQELWHAKGRTGSEEEFKSDVVSIKVAGEWFLCQSLLNLVGHQNGEVGPDTYGEEFATYLSIFREAGVDASELTCESIKETHGERTKKILQKHPEILTKVKKIILSRY